MITKLPSQNVHRAVWHVVTFGLAETTWHAGQALALWTKMVAVTIHSYFTVCIFFEEVQRRRRSTVQWCQQAMWLYLDEFFYSFYNVSRWSFLLNRPFLLFTYPLSRKFLHQKIGLGWVRPFGFNSKTTNVNLDTIVRIASSMSRLNWS